MGPAEYGLQAGNQLTMIGNSVIGNYFTGRRQMMAEEQEKRLMQELSLRERMFQAQQSQFDQDYSLRYRQIGLQEEQQKLNERVQTSNMEVQRRQGIDFEADSYAAPIITKITGDLQSLAGDPNSVLNYQPDLSELDKLPEDVGRRAKSKVLIQLQPYRDQLLAASDELKEASATGQRLLTGAPYLNNSERYGSGASLKAKALGRKILRRQPLTPEEEQLVIDYNDGILRESASRDPKLTETKAKISGNLLIENLKSAVAEYQAASRLYNDTLNNITASDSTKRQAKEELDLASANLKAAKAMAGVKQTIFEDDAEPEQEATEPQASPQAPTSTQQKVQNTIPTTESPVVVSPATNAPTVRTILPAFTPPKYPTLPSQRKTNSINPTLPASIYRPVSA